MMHHQFNILTTVRSAHTEFMRLYLSENKQRLVPLTA
jgi:hypothetical protein